VFLTSWRIRPISLFNLCMNLVSKISPSYELQIRSLFLAQINVMVFVKIPKIMMYQVINLLRLIFWKNLAEIFSTSLMNPIQKKPRNHKPSGINKIQPLISNLKIYAHLVQGAWRGSGDPDA
jgi:hypothetical protein